MPVELLQQAGRIVVILQQALEDPADRQFQVQELRGWLLEVLLDVCQAVARGLATGEHVAGDADLI